MRDIDFITESNLSFLNNFAIQIVLPCFIIASFMQDLEMKFLTSGINIILWAVIIHIIFFIGAHYFYKSQKNLAEDDKILLSNILPLGNISFFGFAIISIFYSSQGVFVANMYSIVNRTILNTFCIITMSGLILERKNILNILKNPTLIASLIGLSIFATQKISPQLTINNVTASIFRIDHSIPFLFNSINKVGGILTPLIWIIVGASITKNSFTIMLRSKYALVFAFQKSIILPILGICIYGLLHKYTGLTIDNEFLPATLMLLVTPVANTALIFSIKYKRSPDLCIACLLTTTFTSLSLFPFFYLLIKYLISIQFL